ncbi:DUF899 family protein [Halomonas glaciei]|uniref:DUF899 family protein n=1 Tax=Vreelandella glaciei TaxID=186761 RepID=A0A7Z0LXN4_9GAMM|nr:DUF899 family protein [Halomonas glaciei]
MSQIESPRVVSQKEWFRARKAHLKNEKALTRMRDLVVRERRELPWVKMEKEYVFDTLEKPHRCARLSSKQYCPPCTKYAWSVLCCSTKWRGTPFIKPWLNA